MVRGKLIGSKLKNVHGALNITRAPWTQTQTQCKMETTPTTSTTSSPIPSCPSTPSSTPPTSPSIQTKKNQSNFRMQAKNFFLTFPQTPTSKDLALERILSSELSVKGVVVAKEKHADGQDHLHIALFLNDKLRTRDPRFFDFICGKHGRYEVMRSPKSSIAYLHKEDPCPLVHGTTTSASNPSMKPKSEIVAEMIDSGSSLSQVSVTHPGFFLLNKRKIEEYASFVMCKRQRESLKPKPSLIQTTSQDSTTIAVTAWLNTNLCSPRNFKQKQMYLYGPPNTLKTSLIMKLMTWFSIYDMPMEDFYDYYDDSHDLVVFDEFKGQKTLTFLNRFIQGDVFSLRKKGSQFTKKKNPAFIFLSNFSPDQVYSKNPDDSLVAFKSRLEIICVEKPIEIDTINFI